MKRSPLAALVVAAFAVPAICVPGADAACPNEALRTELAATVLPDCRSYEQVTPAYKEGFELYSLSFAHSGETAMLESYGAFAGAAGDSEGGLTGYTAHRTSSGWNTESLNPPEAEYPGQTIRAANADSGGSLWELHSAAQSRFEVQLFSRSAEGAWTPIGPLFSPAQVGGEPSHTTASPLNHAVAATSDYSHVVFSTLPSALDAAGHSPRWSFDTTVGSSPSLYEYSGTGNAAPTLVAVRGGKASSELVGRCGAVLGSGELFDGSTFNALSSDGETIFFTPLPEDFGEGQCVPRGPAEPNVAEVDVRVGGSPASRRTARTIDASARSSTMCDAACSASAPADKLFEGASEDGSNVIFASTQDLMVGASEDTTAGDGAVTDERGSGCASTSGPGGCNLYDYSVPTGTLTLIAGRSEVLGISRISADGSHVYFVARAALAGAIGSPGDRVALSPTPGAPNLYVYDAVTRTTAFIATLNAEADGEDWREFDQRPVQASAGEGRFLLFTSRGVPLTRDDSTLETQLFEYDSLTGELTRVSKGEAGYANNGNAVSGGVSGEALAEGEAFHGENFHQQSGGTTIYVVPDGSSVAFASAGQLSPRAGSAEHGCMSVYEFETGGAGAPLSSGRVALISDGLDVQPLKGQGCVGAQPVAMSPTATDILFATADPLVPSDTDGLQRDIYDARVGGGFAPPPVVETCTERGSCPGASTQAPEMPAVATGLQIATGNAAAPGPATRVSVKVLAHSVRGFRVTLTLRASVAGTLVLSGRGMKTSRHSVRAGARYETTVALSRASLAALRLDRVVRLRVTIRLRSATGVTAATSTTVRVRG